MLSLSNGCLAVNLKGIAAKQEYLNSVTWLGDELQVVVL